MENIIPRDKLKTIIVNKFKVFLKSLAYNCLIHVLHQKLSFQIGVGGKYSLWMKSDSKLRNECIPTMRVF